MARQVDSLKDRLFAVDEWDLPQSGVAEQAFISMSFRLDRLHPSTKPSYCGKDKASQPRGMAILIFDCHSHAKFYWRTMDGSKPIASFFLVFFPTNSFATMTTIHQLLPICSFTP